MANLFRKLGNSVLDLLFPLECLHCGGEGQYLCADCFQKLKINTPEDLDRAKINLQVPDLTEIYIAGDYEDKVLSKLIIKYKYNFLSPLGKILAGFLINFWKTLELQKIAGVRSVPKLASILVIPIPLSQKRLRWRGFNQSEIIAREFSASFNYELNLDLKRLKHRPPQAGLNEAERLVTIHSVFSWVGPSLSGQIIILIDDVTTTGATLNEAARILKLAGASQIYGLVLAKG